MHPDLTYTRRLLCAQQTTPEAEIEKAIAHEASDRCRHAFLTTTWEQARLTAALPEAATTPLAGLAVSIKDMFDVAGQSTGAGSLIL